jgi:hypothetical protein
MIDLWEGEVFIGIASSTLFLEFLRRKRIKMTIPAIIANAAPPAIPPIIAPLEEEGELLWDSKVSFWLPVVEVAEVVELLEEEVEEISEVAELLEEVEVRRLKVVEIVEEGAEIVEDVLVLAEMVEVEIPELLEELVVDSLEKLP